MSVPRRRLLQFLPLAVGSNFLGRFASAQTPAKETAKAKETVAGIGGFFFRAHDSKALALWYQEHLGHHRHAYQL